MFLEQRGGVVKQASLDLLVRLSAGAGAPVSAVLAGPLEGPLPAVSGTLYHSPDESLRLYGQGAYADVVAEAFGRQQAGELYMADTALTRDLAPLLSVRLEAALLQGCQELPSDGASCMRPVYSGAAVAVFAPLAARRICTVAPSSFRPEPFTCEAGDVVALPAPDPSVLSAVVREVVMRSGMPDVAEASVVVAGGRGVGGPEGFRLLEELALLLGGAVGASRAAVDEGWRPHAEQIGQTGKSVAPALYIACGISGAVQHLAGIARAGTVVAINSDPHAPFFSAADYGLVGDLHELLPAFTREVGRLRELND